MSLTTAVGFVFSGSALAISATTAWLTLFRRGRIQMTRPRLVFFGWEKTPWGAQAKIFMRCLLFSSGKRGRVIQSMYLRVQRAETKALFSSWAYGERKELVPGSGLFVSQEGVAYNHHFLISDRVNFPTFRFTPGTYVIQVYADVLNLRKHIRLGEVRVTLSEGASAQMNSDGAGTLFDWNPEEGQYVAEVDTPPNPQALTQPPPMVPGLFRL